ncbi:hypothetical protein D9615_007606 [Tricholomella constricta]|uniref:Protein farnesyltransferase subunit beta n=1 Tax=Tricholomella constricta TaxID=117010 RepID=A0A8H5H6Y9_9AGAR|nr:hypothetical protein D9615_007606 [Tricholomella constricta]
MPVSSPPPAPRPTPTDAFPTSTSQTQAETESILLQHIPSNADAKQGLAKQSHMQFLVRSLVQGFPSRYTSQDASQPWLLFWTIQAFSALQVGLDPGNKQRIVDKIMAAQHPDGGFGGGPGQAAHLLPTYASICTLAIVGRPGPGGGWDQINRKKMYDFFMSLKQPDGSFLVAHHAEVDVRGIYCLLVTATLLDLLTPELVSGTASFVASCQTYEGGFSSASQPYYAATPSPSPSPPPSSTSDSTTSAKHARRLLEKPRPPLGEAHGGYTFCALAAWVLLLPFRETEGEQDAQPKIDVGNLLRWLVMMQGTEIELGGFKGRTNKLVDGCYSWWCGGAFALLEALGVGGAGSSAPPAGPSSGEEEEWDDMDGKMVFYRVRFAPDTQAARLIDTLFNRKALQEYILYAGQHPAGGLRDKPPKNADAYHTLYCLSGLSAAQHRISVATSRREQLRKAWVAGASQDTKISESTLPEEVRMKVFQEALAWTEEEGGSLIVGGTENRVSLIMFFAFTRRMQNATHPVFNLTITHSEGLMSYFYGQNLPPRAK